MSEQTNFVQDGVDRVRGAFENLDDEFQRVQKQIQNRRKTIEKRIAGQRKDFEKRTRKEVKRIQTEVRKNPVVKRAESIADDASRQLEQGVDRILAAFQIASRSDLDKIDRKLGKINRKLREIEKAGKNNGSAAASVPSA